MEVAVEKIYEIIRSHAIERRHERENEVNVIIAFSFLSI